MTEPTSPTTSLPVVRFDNRVAIVTGAGGGLGRGYALELARRGARVVVNDLGGARDGSGTHPAPADRVVAEIREAGGEAVASYDNVADTAGGRRIVETAMEAFGSVDILINNAGILRDRSFHKMPDEDWSAVLDVHLTGSFSVTRPAFEIMRERGYGRIVMTTSAAALYGNFGQVNYAAAKMGLVGFMNALRIEGSRYGILVNAVAPVAASRMTEEILPPDVLAQMSPDCVTPLTLFLSSEACTVSGSIFNAGMGTFNRVALVTGPGVRLGDASHPPTPESVRDHWGEITKIEGGQELPDAGAAVLALFSPPA